MADMICHKVYELLMSILRTYNDSYLQFIFECKNL